MSMTACACRASFLIAGPPAGAVRLHRAKWSTHRPAVARWRCDCAMNDAEAFATAARAEASRVNVIDMPAVLATSLSAHRQPIAAYSGEPGISTTVGRRCSPKRLRAKLEIFPRGYARWVERTGVGAASSQAARLFRVGGNYGGFSLTMPSSIPTLKPDGGDFENFIARGARWCHRSGLSGLCSP